MENRAFDHMLGLMTENDPTIEGCSPSMGKKCSNPVDPLDPNSQWYPITDKATQDCCTSGPDQAYFPTLNEVYGFNITDIQGVTPPMTGFIRSFSQFAGQDGPKVMDCKYLLILSPTDCTSTDCLLAWPPDKVPAITTLAREFGVFNRYFSCG